MSEATAKAGYEAFYVASGVASTPWELLHTEIQDRWRDVAAKAIAESRLRTIETWDVYRTGDLISIAVIGRRGENEERADSRLQRERDMLLEAMRRVAASLSGSGLIEDGHPAWPIVRDAIAECQTEA